MFFGEDLGVGGAERLIVDTANACKINGHQVIMLTSHYDPKHCFEDTKHLDIIVKASSLPRHIGGKFHALFAYLKMFLATIWLIYFSKIQYDLVICDQISLPVLALKLFPFKLKSKIKVLFYCHFPDQLLCQNPNANRLKAVYRKFINWLEFKSTSMADVILVNSNFTRNIFYKTFPQLKDKMNLKILYPSLNTDIFDKSLSQNADICLDAQLTSVLSGKKFIILSINRYERKKNLELAVNTMQELKNRIASDLWSKCVLVHAGGYDPRLEENVSYYAELNNLVEQFELQANIVLLKSINDELKIKLLKLSYCLLYTPENEHFGIVPVEAMYCEKPVIATNTGGPLETVKNKQTGFLVKPNVLDFAECLTQLIQNPDLQQKMAKNARRNVIDNFSYISFTQNLNTVITDLFNLNNNKRQ